MKKRSLFAAVAMLIVSAIILTSATYAWFSTGGSTYISKITGQVAEAGAGIRLRTQSDTGSGASGWVNSLDYVKLAKDTTYNHFATNFTSTGDMTTTGWEFVNPTAANMTTAIVRSDPTNADSDPLTYEPISTANPLAHNPTATPAVNTIFAYRLNGNGYYDAITGDASSFYDEYSFYVATMAEDEDANTNDTDVNMTVKIGGTAKDAVRVAIYTSDDGGSTWNNSGAPLLYSGTSEAATVANPGGWKPLVGALDLTSYTYRDNGNYILDTGTNGDTTTDTDLASKIGSTTATTPASAAAQTIRLQDCHIMNTTSGSNKLVKVFVWIEGQDLDCAPNSANVPGGDVTVEFGFTAAQGARAGTLA